MALRSACKGDGGTALMGAAYIGHERVVDLLIQHGAEVNLQRSSGFTALMSAAGQGRERVVELLLQHGAEINLQNSDGVTADGRRQPRPRLGGRAADTARR